MAAIAANPAGNEFNGVVNNSCLRYQVTINEGAPRQLNPGQRLKFSDFFPPEEAERIPSYLSLKVSRKGKEVEQRTFLDKYSYVALLGKKPKDAHIKVHFNKNPNPSSDIPDEIMKLVAERVQQHIAGKGFHSFHAGCSPEKLTFDVFSCYNEDLVKNGLVRPESLASAFEHCTGHEVPAEEIARHF